MNLEEKPLKQEYIYRGKVLTLRVDKALLPNGKTTTREVVEHNGGVCVVPLTPENEVLMVEQFRYPYGAPVLEIPAGKRDSKTEPPLDCGRRELREETGATAEHMTFLGELYPTPGYCGEIIYMYLAQGLTYGQTDPDEVWEAEEIPDAAEPAPSSPQGASEEAREAGEISDRTEPEL